MADSSGQLGNVTIMVTIGNFHRIKLVVTLVAGATRAKPVSSDGAGAPPAGRGSGCAGRALGLRQVLARRAHAIVPA